MKRDFTDNAWQFYAETYDATMEDWPGELDFYREIAAQTRSRGQGVLELGCGTGRIAIPLARESVAVLGVDISPHMLEIAREKSTGLDNVRWLKGDMRSFNLGETFGLIIISGHTFQNLDLCEDQLSCLDSIQKHLEPEGTLIIHTDHQSHRWLGEIANEKRGAYETGKEFIHPRTGRPVRTLHAWSYERESQTAILRTIWDVASESEKVQERIETEPIRLHCIFRYEMEHMLARAGYETKALYGSFFKETLNRDSSEMIWVARRQP